MNPNSLIINPLIKCLMIGQMYPGYTLIPTLVELSLVGETQNSSTQTNKFTIPNYVDFYKEKGNHAVLERSRGWGRVVREGLSRGCHSSRALKDEKELAMQRNREREALVKGQ